MGTAIPACAASGASFALDEVVRCLNSSSAATVLIDGRSGSGKSTLATQLHQGWTGSELIRLDDIYPGWDGLAWTTGHVESLLLRPLADGRPGHWRSWDWAEQRAGPWHEVAPRGRLVVEGVGVLTPSSRSLADLAIWAHAGDADRKQRALRRDGDDYRMHWDRWAAQEDEFIRTFQPRQSADLIAEVVGDGFTFRAAHSLDADPSGCATFDGLERGSSDVPG